MARVSPSIQRTWGTAVSTIMFVLSWLASTAKAKFNFMVPCVLNRAVRAVPSAPRIAVPIEMSTAWSSWSLEAWSSCRVEPA